MNKSQALLKGKINTVRSLKNLASMTISLIFQMASQRRYKTLSSTNNNKTYSKSAEKMRKSKTSHSMRNDKVDIWKSRNKGRNQDKLICRISSMFTKIFRIMGISMRSMIGCSISWIIFSQGCRRCSLKNTYFKRRIPSLNNIKSRHLVNRNKENQES